MKKLLALLVVGGLLALTTGCPPGTTSEEVKPPKPTPGGTTPPAGSTNTPKDPVKGALKKVDGNKIAVGDTKDIDITGAIVTINGKDAKAADIKAADDTTATVTYDKSGKVAMDDVKTAAPAPPPPPAETTTEGTITKVDADKKMVTVKDKAGKETPVAVGADTKITLDTKDAKISDLKEGQTVTVKAKGDTVESIDAAKAAATPPPPPPPPPPAAGPVKGKVKSAAKDKVTITDADGKDVDLAVTDDTKVTIDGKDGKAADIKKDSTVTATKDGDKVTKIDATSPK